MGPAEEQEWLPRTCPGRITGLNLPGGIGVRVDTAACTDCTISPYCDSVIAKVITFGRDRAESIARMHRALEMFVAEGTDPDFLAGRFDTKFVKRFMPCDSPVVSPR
jgi:acetyl-CoA carboxylase biotin carboxylase subunit